MEKEKKYPIIDVPPTNKSGWIGGAFCLYFVYSKYNGNFILRGYQNEVKKYLKKHYRCYFYYNSMWYRGMSRGYWRFWKDSVLISRPNKDFKEYKYCVEDFSSEKKLEFKRLPKRWVKEFDLF